MSTAVPWRFSTVQIPQSGGIVVFTERSGVTSHKITVPFSDVTSLGLAEIVYRSVTNGPLHLLTNPHVSQRRIKLVFAGMSLEVWGKNRPKPD